MPPSAVPEFQSTLVRLSDNLNGKLTALTSRLSRLDQPEQLRYVTEAYPAIATPYIAAAGDVTTVWYDEQGPKALKRGAKAFRATPAELPPVDKLAANGRWAMLQKDPRTALQGAARRATFNQSRETVVDNAEREGVRWVRHARGGACGFCRMLATRVLTEHQSGAPGLYRSEGSASRNTHRPNAAGHDHCRCIAVPLRDGAQYVVPDYLPQWLDDYNAVSRDGNGRLLDPGAIAARMEKVGAERDAATAAAKRARRRPDVVNLDEPGGFAGQNRERVASAQRLTSKGAERADAFAQPLRDRAAQAQAIAARADEIAAQAAKVSGRVKQVTDVADKLLGTSVPIVRNVKTIVDATDKALQATTTVTGEALKVANLANKTLDDTVGIAHGVEQIADEVGGVLDEAAAIAVGARAFLGDTGRAVKGAAADVKGADGVKDFADRIAAAVDTATGIHAEATALVDRARNTVAAAQAIPEAVRELPDVVRRPVADAQRLAQGVRDAAAAVDQAGDDAAGVARSVRRLVDAVAEWWAAERAPVRVASERVDVPKAITLEPLDVQVVDAPKAIAPEPVVVDLGPLALDTPPVRLALEAAPPTPPTDLNAIGKWLDAEDDHIHAVDYWRRVDAEDLHSIPAEIVEPPAAPVITESPMDVAVREFEEAVATGNDDLIEAAAERMEALELAEDKAAARAQKAADRREAKGNAEADAIGARIEAGEDPQQAEADVLLLRRENQKKVEAFLAQKGNITREEAERVVFNALHERIIRRDFIRQARADGHVGNGFDQLVSSVHQRMVDEIYIQAENATNGAMIKHRYELKIGSYKKLWYVNDSTARKWMTEEMARWFDENGRLTLQDLRESVLSGRPVSQIAAGRTNQDYHQ